jgi:hypothetical protein
MGESVQNINYILGKVVVFPMLHGSGTYPYVSRRMEALFDGNDFPTPPQVPPVTTTDPGSHILARNFILDAGSSLQSTMLCYNKSIPFMEHSNPSGENNERPSYSSA